MLNMYRSVNYLIIVFIIFLSLKSIMIESDDLKTHVNQSKLKKWRTEKRYSTPTIIVNNQSQTSSSFEFCIPFHNCHTQMNRTVLIIVVSVLILTCCCYYQCYEYCNVKHELDEQKLRSTQQHRCIDISNRNRGFLV